MVAAKTERKQKRERERGKNELITKIEIEREIKSDRNSAKFSTNYCGARLGSD